MEPVSFIASIAGLVGVIAQTSKITKTYIHKARHGKETAAKFLKELDVLHFNLSRLDKFLSHDLETIRQFDNTSVLVSSTYACRNKLDALQEKLSMGCQKRHLNINTFVWPLKVKEHRQVIGELRAFAQWTQFALSVDGVALVSKTSTEVLEVLRNQLDSFQLLQQVDDRTLELERSLDEQNRSLHTARANKQRDGILTWMSTLDHIQMHYDTRKPRAKGTGDWFLREISFKAWEDTTRPGNSVLWCHGIQGSGKSILTSLVIDHLKDSLVNTKTALAYSYFNYQDRDRQSAEMVLRSLLRQLLMLYDELPKQLLELHSRTEMFGRPLQLEDIGQALQFVCADFDHTFLIIDALDECDKEERKILLRALSGLQKKSTVRLFLTSRPQLDDEIRRAFGETSRFEIGAAESDLATYLSMKIDDSDNVDVIGEDFKAEIIAKVVQGARQMFLLAVLQVKAVLDKPTAGEMEEALDRMPRDIGDAFGETLQRIQNQPDGQNTLGMNTLMWLANARRPLLVTELSEALAIRLGSASLKSKFRPSQKRMVDCCMGLATVDEESAVIRLMHHSVQEYLHTYRGRVFETDESDIAQKCITYLLFESFALGPRQSSAEIEELISRHIFVRYAAHHWGKHVLAANHAEVDMLALEFLRAEAHRGCSHQILHYTRNYREDYWREEEARSCNGLHLAAIFGLEGLARQLLDAGEVEVNAATTIGTTALMKAASYGHERFIRLLLSNRADPTRENWYGTALHAAAEAGHVSAILELVKAGADVNIKQSEGRSPLHCATVSGHQSAIQTLLDLGADINLVCRNDYTALKYAILWEHSLEIIQILLERGANTEIQSTYGVTALHHAAAMNSGAATLLLLRHGANVHARDAYVGTPLHLAAARDHPIVIQHLLANGAKVDARTEDGISALDLATRNGNEESMQALLEGGANTNNADHQGLTPLDTATKEKQKSLMQMLRKQERFLAGMRKRTRIMTGDMRYGESAYRKAKFYRERREKTATQEDH